MLAEIREALESKKISSAELVKHYIDKAKSDPLGCFITVAEEEALLSAQSADERLANGERGTLLGIPVAVKDNICTKGIRTTCASKVIEDFVPPYDAEAISKLKKSGAVIFAKTNMDEFGMGAANIHSCFGRVKNPYDRQRVSGGSSGGSAAAVASGAAPCALGSDTGGSVRLPAAFCGVTGFKPSYGRVSRQGLVAFASSFDEIGVIARSALDCALVTDAMSGSSGADMTAKSGLSACFSKNEADFKGIKIGVIKEFVEGSAGETAKAVLNAADFYRSLGAEIIEASLPSAKYALGAYYLLSCAQAASNLARFDGIRYGARAKGQSFDETVAYGRACFGSEVKRRILLGNSVLSKENFDKYYLGAQSARDRIEAEYNEIFSRCRFVITPTAPDTAPLAKESENVIDAYRGDLCTVTANLAGLPSVSTPCGYGGGGMPIGMMLTAARFDDAAVISAAAAFESAFERREACI